MYYIYISGTLFKLYIVYIKYIVCLYVMYLNICIKYTSYIRSFISFSSCVFEIHMLIIPGNSACDLDNRES